MADNGVEQEIADGSSFDCPECHQQLDEILVVGLRPPLPKWYVPLIGLIILILAGITFFLVPPPIQQERPPEPPKPPEKVIFTSLITDKDIFVVKSSPKLFVDSIGPFQTNIPVDSIYWEVIDQTKGFSTEPALGYGKSIIAVYTRPTGETEGSITFKVFPIHKGKKGDEMEFSRYFKAKPSTVLPTIQITSNGSKIMLKANQKVVDIPKHIFVTNQPNPDAIRWKLNRNRSSQAITLSNLPDNGTGEIPNFKISFSEVPSLSKIVFEVEPIKNGFTSVKSIYSILLAAPVAPAEPEAIPCASPETINAFNTSAINVIGEFEELLYMISKTKDPVMNTKYISDANSEIRKVSGISVQVVGFSNLTEYLNSGFTGKPAIAILKNDCKMINGIRITP
ncbi:MAG: hypothetical protein ACOYN4_01690 [Bacteroidales bacterium]